MLRLQPVSPTPRPANADACAGFTRLISNLLCLQAMARLKQRRKAARVERKRHEAEEEAVAELRDIKEQGAALAKHAPQLGKPVDRSGYGIGGVEMF